MPITKTALPKIPAEALTQLEALNNRPIDLSDVPEITDWRGAKRGMFRMGKTNPTNTQSQAVEQNSLEKENLFEQDFVGWLSSQPVQTKQKVQDLVRIALNLGHAEA